MNTTIENETTADADTSYLKEFRTPPLRRIAITKTRGTAISFWPSLTTWRNPPLRR